MNRLNKETFTRSDIESSLKKEFPNLSKSEISSAIDVILRTITDAVALDEKLKYEDLELFKEIY